MRKKKENQDHRHNENYFDLLRHQKTPHVRSPNTALQKDVTQILQSKTSLEEPFDGVPLPSERVDDVVAGLDEGRLEHVGQEREDGVERLVLGFLVGGAVLNAGEELGEDGQVEDEWRGEERVFAFVEDVESVLMKGDMS